MAALTAVPDGTGYRRRLGAAEVLPEVVKYSKHLPLWQLDPLPQCLCTS